MTRLLAMAASHRTPSLNKHLLALAIEAARGQDTAITELDYAALDTPYRGESKGSPLPPAIERLSEALRTHDGILLAVPEYNWSIPGALKNLIDWLSLDSRTPWQGKTALLMCASPSPRGGVLGLQQLRMPLQQLGCWVYPQLISIGRASEQLQHGTFDRAADEQHLSTCVADFVRATKALASYA